MRYITDEYSKGDAYLLGRVTYDMLWPGWSKQTTDDGPGPILNRMHKYVVSTTLSKAPKESTIISGNVVEEIAKLKQQLRKDIILDGGATLVQSLMGTGLIDEFRFLVQPFIMGTGRRFVRDGTPPTNLRLVGSEALGFRSLALCLPTCQQMRLSPELLGYPREEQSRHSLLLRGSSPAGKLLIRLDRRDVRVVEGARLESDALERYRNVPKHLFRSGWNDLPPADVSPCFPVSDGVCRA